MFKKYQDIFASVFLMSGAAVMFLATYNIHKLTVSKIGAEFVPRIIAIAIFILSLSLLVQALKKLKFSMGTEQSDMRIEQSALEEAEKQDIEEVEGEEQKKKANVFSVVATIILLFVYISLLSTIGFLIMTTVYLFLQMYLLADQSHRKVPLFVVISVISSTAIYYCFKSLFHLMLPAGILG